MLRSGDTLPISDLTGVRGTPYRSPTSPEFVGHHIDLRPHLGVEIEVRNHEPGRIWTWLRLRRRCQGSEWAAYRRSGRECGSSRHAPEFQPSLRLQCHRNAVTSLLPGHAVWQVAIRRKSLVPKVGLEPTRVLPHRILSPARLAFGGIGVILKPRCKSLEISRLRMRFEPGFLTIALS